MATIEIFYFKDQTMMDMVTKGKRVFRRNLKKKSVGIEVEIDGKLNTKVGERTSFRYRFNG